MNGLTLPVSGTPSTVLLSSRHPGPLHRGRGTCMAIRIVMAGPVGDVTQRGLAVGEPKTPSFSDNGRVAGWIGGGIEPRDVGDADEASGSHRLRGDQGYLIHQDELGEPIVKNWGTSVPARPMFSGSRHDLGERGQFGRRRRSGPRTWSNSRHPANALAGSIGRPRPRAGQGTGASAIRELAFAWHRPCSGSQLRAPGVSLPPRRHVELRPL